MSGGEVGSYQDLAFDPVYFEAPCPECGGFVTEDDGVYRCDDCDWSVDE